MKNRNRIIVIGVLAICMFFAAGLTHADLSSYVDGNAKTQMSAFMKLLFWVIAIVGVCLCAICGWYIYLIKADKAPQRVAEHGVFPQFVGLIVGGIFLSFSVFLIGTAETVSGEQNNDSTWQELQSGDT